MNPSETCPFCRSANVWPGTIFQDTESSNLLILDDIKVPWWRPFINYGIKSHSRVTLCLSCGRFWGSFDLEEAHDFVAHNGSDEIKARLRQLAE